jgi:hypothetical protein
MAVARVVAAAGCSGGHGSGGDVPLGPQALIHTAQAVAADSSVRGVHVTRRSNIVVRNGEPVPFDAEVVDTGGLWNKADPTKLTIQRDGWFWVGADITTLGTDYGGPPNNNVQIAILKNWDGKSTQLPFYVVYERFANRRAELAQGNSTVQPIPLRAGDVLQLTLIGPTDDGLLVESNPSDGKPRGFVADTGPGTLSPHMYAIRIG